VSTAVRRLVELGDERVESGWCLAACLGDSVTHRLEAALRVVRWAGQAALSVAADADERLTLPTVMINLLLGWSSLSAG
jgi:hypothetical protein